MASGWGSPRFRWVIQAVPLSQGCSNYSQLGNVCNIYGHISKKTLPFLASLNQVSANQGMIARKEDTLLLPLKEVSGDGGPERPGWWSSPTDGIAAGPFDSWAWQQHFPGVRGNIIAVRMFDTRTNKILGRHEAGWELLCCPQR